MNNESKNSKDPAAENTVEHGLAVIVNLLTSDKEAKVKAGVRGLNKICEHLPLLERLTVRLFRLHKKRRGASKARTLAAYQHVMALAWDKQKEEDRRMGKHHMYIEDGKVVVD